MNTRLVASTLACLLAVGCGSSQEQKKAEEAAKQMEQGAKQMEQAAQQMQQGAQNSQQQMAQGLQQMAQGFQQMTQGSNKAVDFEKLTALMPEIGGWTRGEVHGEQTSMPMQTSNAEATFEKGESRIRLEITDTAMSQMLLAPITIFMGTGFSERSDDGFKRAVKVGGQPGFEEWQKKARHGEVTALVNSRFVVNAKGDDVDSIDVVRKAVESVDFAKLASLK